MNGIVIYDPYGHGIMSAQWKVASGPETKLFVSSKKETKEEYTQEVEKTMKSISFFTDCLPIPWKERSKVHQLRNIVLELKDREKFEKLDWNKFFSVDMSSSIEMSTPLQSGIMVVPGKFISDSLFGVNALSQSLPLEVFDCLKGYNCVLGQHFDVKTELTYVKKIADEQGWVIPGYPDHACLGLRGLTSEVLASVYQAIDGCVGIAGTHTWFLLAKFPNKPQVILYHKGLEDWQTIARFARLNGRKVYAIEYDDNTPIITLKKQVKKACKIAGLWHD